MRKPSVSIKSMLEENATATGVAIPSVPTEGFNPRAVCKELQNAIEIL